MICLVCVSFYSNIHWKKRKYTIDDWKGMGRGVRRGSSLILMGSQKVSCIFQLASFEAYHCYKCHRITVTRRCESESCCCPHFQCVQLLDSSLNLNPAFTGYVFSLYFFFWGGKSFIMFLIIYTTVKRIFLNGFPRDFSAIAENQTTKQLSTPKLRTSRSGLQFWHGHHLNSMAKHTHEHFFYAKK